MQTNKLFYKKISNAKIYLTAFCRWSVLGVLIGIICGVVGALFSHSISFVTNYRESNPTIIFLLPLGGLLSVLIYKIFKVTDVGTNQVFESVKSNKKVPFLLAPAVFIGSVITHLLGGSAGREGAALQLGGSLSSVVGKVFKLSENQKHTLTVCGMGAVFSAVFGTPIGAFVFALEVVRVGNFRSSAIFPSIVSSITAYGISCVLGVSPERFTIPISANLEFSTLWRVIIISVLTAFLSVVFCEIMHFSESFFKKTFKNEFLRIFIGGIIIVGLTLILNTHDYNGGGINIIENIFHTGQVKYEAFILKMIFTAITIGVGYKGGEIVPTFFIGATFGGAMASLIGLNVPLGAAIGMAAMFCGVTNCPLATIILCAELFGGSNFIILALASVIGFFLSGYSSLYSSQKILFSKIDDIKK